MPSKPPAVRARLIGRLHFSACQNMAAYRATRDAIKEAKPAYHLQSSVEWLRPTPVFCSVARSVTLDEAAAVLDRLS